MKNLQIETDLHYSTGDSWDFDENFKVIEEPAYRTHGLYFYTGFGNEEFMDMDDLKSIDPETTLKHDLLEYALSVDWNYYTKTEVRSMNKDELIELIQGNSDFDYMDLHEVEKEMSEANIGIMLDKYDIEKSYGYNDVMQYVIKTEYNTPETRKYIDNICWNSRIFGTINVSFSHTKNAVNYEFNEEFEFNEVCEDEYEADLNVDHIIRQINREVLIPLRDDECEQIRIKLRDVDYTDVKYPCAC